MAQRTTLNDPADRREDRLRTAEDALRCLGLLPLPLLYLLLCPLALLFFAPQPWFWRRIFGNLRYIAPECSRHRRIWIGLRRALYFGEQLAEWLRTPWVDTAHLSAGRAPLQGASQALAAQQGHLGPVFLLSCHQGSFLWSMLALRFHFTPWSKAPAIGIFQRQHGLSLRRLLIRHDQQYRADFLDSGHSFMRRLAKLRRTGATSIIFALGDNAAKANSPPSRVLRVPMLGGERFLRLELSEVAVKVGAPVFFLHSRRLGFGRYETIVTLLAKPPYRDGDVQRVLRHYANLTAQAYEEAPQFSQLLLNNPNRWLEPTDQEQEAS